MIDPYVAAKGVNILFEDYSGGVAEMTAQVESGNIQWDVVDIEAVDLERACSEGLLEVIPRDILPAGDDGTPAADDFYPASLVERVRRRHHVLGADLRLQHRDHQRRDADDGRRLLRHAEVPRQARAAQAARRAPWSGR